MQIKNLTAFFAIFFSVLFFSNGLVYAAPACGTAHTCSWKNTTDITTSDAGFTPFPGFKMCATGIGTNLTTLRSGLTVLGFSWNCTDGTTISCSAGYAATSTCPVATNGVCGSSNNTAASSKPTSNLCGDGSLPAVSGTGPWTWTCAGTGGGTSASCSAYVACGSVNETIVDITLQSSAPNLCAAGTVSNWTLGGDNGAYWWTCPGNPNWCIAHIRGVCGAANGHTF
ncbi:MAG: hypothetical protein WC303_00105, partial [Candidatus Paceibacterota bacterium]